MPPSFRMPLLLYICLAAAVLTIPLKNQLNSIAIILFALACVVQQSPASLIRRLKTPAFWNIPVLYFLWMLLSAIWDTERGFEFREVERYLVFLFLPPVIAAIPRIPEKIIRRVCLLFVVTIVVLCFTSLLRSFLEFRITGDSRVFFYHYLSEQVGLNAIFLSNYCLASIMWVLYFGFLDPEDSTGRQKIWTAAAAVFLVLMLLLLSSKLLIMLSAIMILLWILILGYRNGHLLKSVVVMALLLVAGYAALKNFSYLRWRFDVTEIKQYEGPQDDQNGLAIRLFMWNTALENIRDKPLLGYGLRGARTETLKDYEAGNFEIGVRNRYHSHNQYLESALIGGIPALLMLIVFILAAIVAALRYQNILLLLITVHFAVQSVFESTFQVQHEQVFYIILILLFYYHAPEKGRMFTLNRQ